MIAINKDNIGRGNKLDCLSTPNCLYFFNFLSYIIDGLYKINSIITKIYVNKELYSGFNGSNIVIIYII